MDMVLFVTIVIGVLHYCQLARTAKIIAHLRGIVVVVLVGEQKNGEAALLVLVVEERHILVIPVLAVINVRLAME